MIRTTGIKQHFKQQAALQESSRTSGIKPHFKDRSTLQESSRALRCE